MKNAISVLLDGRCLSRVNKTKFLGVIIDENLSFKYHVEAISNTISRNRPIGIFNKLKRFVPKRLLLCICCSIILPFLFYGILAWGNTHTIYLERLLNPRLPEPFFFFFLQHVFLRGAVTTPCEFEIHSQSIAGTIV